MKFTRLIAVIIIRDNKYNFDLVIHAACTPYEGLSIVSFVGYKKYL